MEPFATVTDYTDRYGAVQDARRLSALLGDATAFIACQAGFAMREDTAFRANLVRVTCSVVNRSLRAGDWAGMQSLSQSAGGQSASVTVYNPAGDFFLTKAERSALGISRGRVGATDPYGGGADG